MKKPLKPRLELLMTDACSTLTMRGPSNSVNFLELVINTYAII